MKKIILALAVIAITPGCMSVAHHKSQVQDNSTDRVTVGTAQREIRVGMSGADVAAVLGSPNIVSTDDQRREVWIYDKISTETAYSTSSGGISALILGPLGAFSGGALSASGKSNSGASSSSQKTLTIIIKYDENKMVRDFAYHTSRF